MKHRPVKGSFAALANMYAPNFWREIVYMLSASEYHVGGYLRWFWRTRDVGRVMYRRKLTYTPITVALLVICIGSTLLQIGLALWLISSGVIGPASGLQFLAFAILISQPLITAHLVLLPVIVTRLFIARPLDVIRQAKAKPIFAKHPGKIIVIAGSYGKTSMKEILGRVLASGLKVAMTPGNQNTKTAHARFASKLSGKEDVLIIELGDYVPGDIAKYCDTIQPDYGVITGLAPVNLHNFGTLEKAGENIFGLAKAIDGEHVYVNDENEALKPFIGSNLRRYSRTATLGWSISHINTTLDGTSFTMQKDKKVVKLRSGLVGNHVVGPLALAVALAIDEFGLTKKDVIAAVGRTVPFEHVLQPIKLPSGAWMIDDTININIEGVKAAVDLIKEVKAKRKIYVTPGLVGQGIENVSVHNQLGVLVADAFDEVILMRNHTTPLIEAGLTNAGFTGVLRKVDDPFKFYESIPYLVSAGDVILLQNDWTDNYS